MVVGGVGDYTLVKTCLVTYYVNHISFFFHWDSACSACVMINREGIRGVKLRFLLCVVVRLFSFWGFSPEYRVSVMDHEIKRLHFNTRFAKQYVSLKSLV